MKESNLFDRLYIDLEKFSTIRNEFQLSITDLSEKVKQFESTKADEINEIRRIRQLYNNRSKAGNLKFKSFKSFYLWIKKQYELQKGECYYCRTSEKVVRELFNQGILRSARQFNRGKHLEIDRKDPFNNEYNEDNCVLACYFCNNDKSDIFNEIQYVEYLRGRKNYLEKLIDNK